MHTNMRHGGGQGPPNFTSGRGILGEMPGMFPGPGSFNQNNAMLGGNIPRPNMPNNQGSGPRFGPMNNRAMGGFGKGDSQHIPSLMQQNMFMGKMAQQPQQQQNMFMGKMAQQPQQQQNMFMGKMAQQPQQQQMPLSQMTAQQRFQNPTAQQGFQNPTAQQGFQNPTAQQGFQNPTGQQGFQNPTTQQGFQNPTQNMRDTQLNIVNNLLKGAMSGGNGQGPGLGSLNNNNGGNSSSILGSFPARPPGPIPGNNFAGMKAPFLPQGQPTPMPPRPLLPGFPGQFNNNNNNNGPGIPSIFDINTNPSNMSNRFAQRKRNPSFSLNNDQFAPAMKRNRPDQRQFPPGGTFIQNQANDRPAIRNDSFKRSASRFSVGRRDSSGSNQSERSQSSHGQNNRGSISRTSKGEYDPAKPTNSRSGSVDSAGVQEDADGDFSVTIDSKGRSVSDRKEERQSPAKVKKSQFFCHTCNVDCSDKQNFGDHMKSDFHQERMEGLLNLTQQKSNHLQARIAAEAHLRNIEGKGDNHDRSAFCKTCDSSFTGSIVQHRQSDEHKMKEKKDWAECKVCSQVFKSPQKFVRHMNTAHHKDNAARDKETDRERDADKLPPFDGQSSYGEDFIVAISGTYCKLCRKFYKSLKTTGADHCRSRSHYNKYQVWLQDKKTGSCHGNGTITVNSPGNEPDDPIIVEIDEESNQGNSRYFSVDLAECETSNHSDDFHYTNPAERILEDNPAEESLEDNPPEESLEDNPAEEILEDNPPEDISEDMEDQLLSDQ